MAVEDRLNQSLDDIIKRNRETSKPKTKAGSKQGGERKGRGSFRDDGRNGRDARVAVVRVTQTKRPAGGPAGGRRGRSSSGTFVDYDGSLHVDKDPAPGRPRVDAAAVRAAVEGSAKWQHDKYQGPGPSRGLAGRIGRAPESGFKLVINNLHHNVSDEDVKELFESLGNIKRAGIVWDNSGRSSGVAEVVFERKGDALAAQKKYNNVALDGQAMQIELVESESAVAGRGSATLSSGIRVGGQAPRRVVARGSGRLFSQGGASRGGRTVTARVGRSAKTLDEDLDSYMQE